MNSVLTTERPMFGRRDPDARGYFGAYGGRFVPETLVAPIEELTAGYLAAREDPANALHAPSPTHRRLSGPGSAAKAGVGYAPWNRQSLDFLLHHRRR